ncbi:MAG: nuclear transport factor 2 family protein [Ferruginibacter sp.]
MKIFLIITATLFIFNSPTFSQQKMKTKNNETKVKMKGEMVNMNTKVESDTMQAAELVKLSKTWMDAMMQHDSSKLEIMMAAEYNLKKGDGTVVMERAGWLNNLFHNLKIDKFEQSGISALVFGNVGIVTSLYTWAGSMHNNQFDSKGYITDVWLKRDNRWQVVSRTSAPFPGSNTLEGK